MGFVKCYDAVEMVTDEATKQFGSLFKVNAGQEAALKTLCGVIDSMAENFGGISYEVEVNDETMEITISLVCNEFETDKEVSEFHKVSACANKVVFKAADSEHLQIDFVFGGIWERTM